MAEEFAEKQNLLKASGSDAHISRQIGICYVELEDFSSKKELLENLRKATLVKKRAPLYDLALTGLIDKYKKFKSGFKVRKT